MDEVMCAHGLIIHETQNNSDINTYCASCLYDALYNGSLGIYMGIHPDTQRRIRNKEKAKRRKKRPHG